jgi:hypothetical protein
MWISFLCKNAVSSWVLGLEQNIVSGTNRNSQHLLETDLPGFLALLKNKYWCVKWQQKTSSTY